MFLCRVHFLQNKLTDVYKLDIILLFNSCMDEFELDKDYDISCAFIYNQLFSGPIKT